MSAPPPGARIVQEEDRADALRAWVTVGAVLGVVLVLIGASLWLLRVYAGRHTVPEGAVAEEPALPASLRYGVHEGRDEPAPPAPPRAEWGWVSREDGVATIPIEAAMDLVVRLNRDGGGG